MCGEGMGGGLGRETERGREREREGMEVCGLEHLFLHCLSFPLRSMAGGAGRAYLYPALGPVTAVAPGQAVADWSG